MEDAGGALAAHQRMVTAEQHVTMAHKHIAAAREQLALAQEQVTIAQEQVMAATPHVQSTRRLTMSVQEAAEALGVSHTEIYRLVATAELRSIKIGRRRLVPIRELEAFIARRIAEEV